MNFLLESIAATARAVSVTAVVVFGVCATALSQAPSVSSYMGPGELVRRVVQNEVRESNNPSAHFLFRGTKTTPKGSTTKIYVETSDATAGMVVGNDGKPLSPEQRRAEEARIGRFVKSPEELRKKRAQEREDAERTMRIVRALPEAFLYEYAGEEKGSAGIGRTGDPLVKLAFRPNSKYKPPSHVEEVLTGMQGELLLDAARGRIASIDGTLFKDVGFGWGILGHLDRGGRFVVHQEAVEDNLWEISYMSLKLTGRILLVKGLSIDSTEVFSGFRRVAPDLTFAEAVAMLKKENAGATESSREAKGARR